MQKGKGHAMAGGTLFDHMAEIEDKHRWVETLDEVSEGISKGTSQAAV